MAQPQQNNPSGQSQQVQNDAAALDAAFPTRQVERRQAPRLKYQVVATLEPVSTKGPEDVCVVTRDASTSGASFLSSGDLPEGSRAVLHLPAPDGQSEPQRIECLVRRSREVANGLFEGSVEFVGDQPQFSDTRIRPVARK